uniref:Uncharacterized protein n=1 Tax=Polysiphonia infestans TaxID=2006978 RepID=A0A1Z1MES0_9FLOR|nr:hypothetical protein [Polysiphonia infestans]ARW64261.1 hypothetical protein [Polysiphonia infestans]
MYRGFHENKELTSSSAIYSIKKTVTPAKARNSDIKRIRRWEYCGKTLLT